MTYDEQRACFFVLGATIWEINEEDNNYIGSVIRAVTEANKIYGTELSVRSYLMWNIEKLNGELKE